MNEFEVGDVIEYMGHWDGSPKINVITKITNFPYRSIKLGNDGCREWPHYIKIITKSMRENLPTNKDSL